VLAIFGFNNVDAVNVSGFALNIPSAEIPTVAIGEEIVFSFEVEASEDTKVRLEYGIDYMKSNGKTNRKIFQISEISFKKNKKKPYTKAHSFADVSTRKHYPGAHSITLIANGSERGTLDFEVVHMQCWKQLTRRRAVTAPL
jgi:hypothetical protein